MKKQYTSPSVSFRSLRDSDHIFCLSDPTKPKVNPGGSYDPDKAPSRLTPATVSTIAPPNSLEH